MDRKGVFKIIKTISIILIVGLFAAIFLHKLSISNTGSGHTSDSISQSRQDGFFINDYVPIKDACFLKFRPGKFFIDTAWTQYPWHWEPNNFITTKEKHSDDNYYCFCFKIRTENMKYHAFSLSLLTDRKAISFSYNINGVYSACPLKLLDTMKVLVSERNTKDSKDIITDTITFVKLGHH